MNDLFERGKPYKTAATWPYKRERRPAESLAAPSTAMSTPFLRGIRKLPCEVDKRVHLHISTRSRAQEDGHAGDILRLPQPAHGIVVAQRLLAAEIADEALGELRGEEPGCDDVAGDVLGAKLD